MRDQARGEKTARPSSNAPVGKRAAGPSDPHSIAEICAAVEQLFRVLSEGSRAAGHGLAQEGADLDLFYEEQADAAWARAQELAEILARAPAATFEDLLGKIAVWKRLAPETTFDDDEQSADEILLCSIIGDIARLAGGGPGPRSAADSGSR